jgi:hypothetical protein
MDVTSREMIINFSYAIVVVQIVTKANVVRDTNHTFFKKQNHRTS